MRRMKHKNIWEAVVILVCVLGFGFAAAQKEGFHMDEMLSYEFSNAEFNPWIVPTQPQGRLAKFVEEEIRGSSAGETIGNVVNTVRDVLDNGRDSKLLSYRADVYEEPVFISREQFEDYITVEDSDGFNYLSVYFNVKDDNHPPLHFMALHTVSSIFRYKAEPFMGCLINILAVAGSMVLLTGIGRRLAVMLGMEEKAELLGILAAAFYGISTGALSTVLLIRMYGMLSFFCVALLFLHLKKWQSQEFDRKKKLLILVTALGFWTQYFFLFYCLLLALVTVVLLALRKNWRKLWCYIRSMMLAAVIGIAGFPFAVSDVLSSGRGVEAVQNLSSGFRGYGERLAAFGAILADKTLVLWFALSALLLGGIALWRGKRPAPHGERKAALALLLIPPAGYFLLAARMSPYYVDRYIMAVFPFVALAGTTAVLYAAARMKEDRAGRIAVCAAVICLAGISVWRLVNYDGEYMYKGYAAQEEIAERYSDHTCICVYAGVGYYENLKEFTHYKQTLLTTPEELADRQDRESIERLGSVVVLAKSGVEWEQLQRLLEEQYGFTFCEELLENSVHGDRIGLFVR